MSLPEPSQPPRKPDATAARERPVPADGFPDEDVFESLVNYSPATVEADGGLLDFPESEPGGGTPAAELREAAISLQQLAGELAAGPGAGQTSTGGEPGSPEEEIATLAGKLSPSVQPPPKRPAPDPVPPWAPVFEELEPVVAARPKFFVPRPPPPTPARPGGAFRAGKETAPGTANPPPLPAIEEPAGAAADEVVTGERMDQSDRTDRKDRKGGESAGPGPAPASSAPPPLPQAGSSPPPLPVFVRAGAAVQPVSTADAPLLAVGGLLTVLGILLACRVPVQILEIARLAGEFGDDGALKRNLLSARGLLYAFSAAGALVPGLGALSCRRWAPQIIQATGWVAALGSIAWLAALSAAYAAGGMDTLAGVNAPSIAAGALIAMGVPLAMILAGQRPRAVAACAALDSRPRWTDHQPVPVLMVFVTGIALSCGALSLVPLAPQFAATIPAVPGAVYTAICVATGACGITIAVLARFNKRSSWWILLLTAIVLPAAAALGLAGAGSTADVGPIQAILFFLPAWVVLLMSFRSFYPPRLPDHAS